MDSFLYFSYTCIRALHALQTVMYDSLQSEIEKERRKRRAKKEIEFPSTVQTSFPSKRRNLNFQPWQSAKVDFSSRSARFRMLKAFSFNGLNFKDMCSKKEEVVKNDSFSRKSNFTKT